MADTQRTSKFFKAHTHTHTHADTHTHTHTHAETHTDAHRHTPVGKQTDRLTHNTDGGKRGNRVIHILPNIQTPL